MFRSERYIDANILSSRRSSDMDKRTINGEYYGEPEYDHLVQCIVYVEWMYGYG
jgi:hypothetical protein